MWFTFLKLEGDHSCDGSRIVRGKKKADADGHIGIYSLFLISTRAHFQYLSALLTKAPLFSGTHMQRRQGCNQKQGTGISSPHG